jgi:ATP-binding cassette subfamily B protein
MSFILHYFVSYKKILLLTLFLAAINQVFSLLDPQVFRMIIDRYVTNFQAYDARTFTLGVGWLLLLSVGVAMVSRIAKNFQDYFVNVMTQTIGMRIYQTSMQHAFSLPYALLEDQQSGQLLDKLNKARNSIQQFIGSLINNVFVSLVGLVFVIVYASMVHWVLALFYAGVMPLMGVIVYHLSKKLKAAQQTIVTETASLAGATTESIRNVSLVKSLGLEDSELQRLEDVNTKILWLEIKKIKTVRTIDFFQWTLINFVRVCLLGTMFWMVFQQIITLGEFFSLYFYSFYIFSPLYMLGEVLKNYQEAKASHELLNDLLQKQPVEEVTHKQHIDTIDTITFTDVTFGYVPEKTVLHAITFALNRGQTVAFVWPSWSGKSTLVKLLLGLYTPQQGEVRINDLPLQSLDTYSLKSMIGLVAQDTQLFSGTVRENLQFVRSDADDPAMMLVLQQAQLHDFATQSWLDTKIGEWGLKLSGGQKQRLAIARALLRNPQVLILDEATSSLDSLVEAEITDTIKSIAKEHTQLATLMIAHRLSTIMHADMIYVLEKGHIVEQWDHATLLAQQWLYNALWREQIGQWV